ncbi:MAG: DNA-3-methyladenine glycosylase 2 family protein [Clostridia bacterium]|nr:DNA-3-methyladenine glycosylase 2 family protein [Clostridia bacterium]
MDKVYIIDAGNLSGVPYVRLGGTGNFSVFKTFDCGQCFRFDPTDTSVSSYSVSGVALGHHVTFTEDRDGVTILGSTEEEYKRIWERYLSLDTDYGEIDRIVTTALDDEGCAVMTRAAEAGRGIRILRQDPWEALCSFIISQNNNIPRIKKIIFSLSEKFGEKTEDGRGFAFPTARALADAGEEELFAMKTGFRAKYIYDAARRVADGELDLDAIVRMENYADAEGELMKIKGVGPKVAACALLFGFGKTEAYPVDTWMKKVTARHFKSAPDPKKFGKAAGIAQQYLFYMERYINEGK